MRFCRIHSDNYFHTHVEKQLKLNIGRLCRGEMSGHGRNATGTSKAGATVRQGSNVKQSERGKCMHISIGLQDKYAKGGNSSRGGQLISFAKLHISPVSPYFLFEFGQVAARRGGVQPTDIGLVPSKGKRLLTSASMTTNHRTTYSRLLGLHFSSSSSSSSSSSRNPQFLPNARHGPC